MQGHDLEHSSEAWDATIAILKTKSTHYRRIAEIISVVIHKYFNMSNFAAVDKGPFCELTRFRTMQKAFQIRIMAANEPITAALGIAVNIIPKDMDKIRIHETVMRGLI